MNAIGISKETTMVRLFRKTALIILFVALISTPLNASASGVLEATSPSINVLALPEPEIDRIDTISNTVYLKNPDIVLTDRMDLRAIVTVTDDKHAHLQTKEVKVSDTHNIRIALNAELKKDYHITAKFTNHGIDSGGTSALHSHEPEETPPENPTPEASPPTVIYKKSGGSRVETQYIVKELTPETVEVEKLVEAYQPPIYIKGDEVYINGMPEPEDAEVKEALLVETVPAVTTGVKMLNPLVPEMSAIFIDGLDNHNSLKIEKMLLFFYLLFSLIGVVFISFLLVKNNRCFGDKINEDDRENSVKHSAIKSSVNASKMKPGTLTNIKIFFLACAVVIRKRKFDLFMKFNSLLSKEKNHEPHYCYSLNELKPIFELYGSVYEDNVSALPDNVLSIFNQYKRAYASYKTNVG